MPENDGPADQADALAMVEDHILAAIPGICLDGGPVGGPGIRDAGIEVCHVFKDIRKAVAIEVARTIAPGAVRGVQSVLRSQESGRPSPSRSANVAVTFQTRVVMFGGTALSLTMMVNVFIPLRSADGNDQ